MVGLTAKACGGKGSYMYGVLEAFKAKWIGIVCQPRNPSETDGGVLVAVPQILKKCSKKNELPALLNMAFQHFSCLKKT